LAHQLIKLRKHYFFVRSKLDIEITMSQKRNPSLTDEDVILQLRNDIKHQTKHFTVPAEIFILSGELENTDRWDFLNLKKKG